MQDCFGLKCNRDGQRFSQCEHAVHGQVLLGRSKSRLHSQGFKFKFGVNKLRFSTRRSAGVPTAMLNNTAGCTYGHPGDQPRDNGPGNDRCTQASDWREMTIASYQA